MPWLKIFTRHFGSGRFNQKSNKKPNKIKLSNNHSFYDKKWSFTAILGGKWKHTSPTNVTDGVTHSQALPNGYLGIRHPSLGFLLKIQMVPLQSENFIISHKQYQIQFRSAIFPTFENVFINTIFLECFVGRCKIRFFLMFQRVT